MRLTEQQIRETVDRMMIDHTPGGEGDRLICLALANDPGARLVIYAAWRRNNGYPQHPIQRRRS